MNQILKFLARGVSAVALLAFAAICVRAQENARGETKSPDRGAVLVELFTSEGCPHCPEADALLEKLYTEQPIEGAEIIALEEHVDYWDRQEWVDHFSSPGFTQRQKDYADAMDIDSLYTPQMVVDGLVEFVGNNAARARATIAALGRVPLPGVRILPFAAALDGKRPAGGALVRLEARDLSHDSPSEVYLVLAEDKLFSRVSGGKNAGESWPHSSIAHWFHLAGKMPAGSKDFSLVAEIGAPQPGWRVDNLRLIAFVQEEETRRVLALGAVPLADVIPRAAGTSSPAAGRMAPVPAGAVPKMPAVTSNF